MIGLITNHEQVKKNLLLSLETKIHHAKKEYIYIFKKNLIASNFFQKKILYLL